MKSEKEVSSIYIKLLKIYFSNFVEEKIQKIPHNCIFNIQHPLDIVKKFDDEPNPNYNKLGQVRIRYHDILDTGDQWTTFLINDKMFTIENDHFKFPESMRLVLSIKCIFMPVKMAEKYDLQDMTPHIGICKLSLDKEEITICDAETDAEECPAFVNKNTKKTLKKEFWAYAAKHHNDLIVLKDLLGKKEELTFWQKLTGFISFK